MVAKDWDLGLPYEVKIYEDAHHSFDLPIPNQNYLGYTVAGNSEARIDSRKRMLDWFEKFRI